MIKEMPSTNALFKRMLEHRKSIESAENLESSDFKCQLLIVDDIWIPLGEALLISMYSPILNILIDGFGNHDPGKGRYNGKISDGMFCILGREWVSKLQLREETQELLISEVSNFLKCGFESLK